ncbi:glycosyltransferase family 4 protein [Aequorivita marina]|uniref:glycosyltransferase family 4 protein n=1 Tax=Aequorivita marina TaxID=3073654 RepID=UPI0028771A5B|nr:glycosyltransferase family 4 protein [Aequorivita sp. S2608]MDS1298980.1 glycosyltransferase family 4 protein [Aequorivita sp. S2608]
MATKKQRLFLISNMYPSAENVRYGIFVKNFEGAVSDFFYVEKVVLTKKYSLSSKTLGYLKLYLQIAKLYFKCKKDDLVYVHFPLHVAPALLPFWWLNRKVILNFHGSDLIFNSTFKKGLSFFLIPGLRKSFMVLPSNYYKEKLKSQFNVSASKLFVYPSGGINNKVFSPSGREKVESSNFVIGFVSNFIEGKGWRIFLNALKKIKEEKSITNFEILMVGDGPDKSEILDLLAEINIKFEVISNVSQKKLAAIYNQMDVFIFPTYREEESLGLVGLEAMACGIPVIASKTGGPMGYVEEDSNGFLFDKKDVGMLTEKILEFYSRPQSEKDEMKDNAIDTAQSYDSVTVNKQLVEFLENL